MICVIRVRFSWHSRRKARALIRQSPCGLKRLEISPVPESEAPVHSAGITTITTTITITTIITIITPEVQRLLIYGGILFRKILI